MSAGEDVFPGTAVSREHFTCELHPGCEVSRQHHVLLPPPSLAAGCLPTTAGLWKQCLPLFLCAQPLPRCCSMASCEPFLRGSREAPAPLLPVCSPTSGCCTTASCGTSPVSVPLLVRAAPPTVLHYDILWNVTGSLPRSSCTLCSLCAAPPKVLHYGILWNVTGSLPGAQPLYQFDKHWFEEFDALACPPWEIK